MAEALKRMEEAERRSKFAEMSAKQVASVAEKARNEATATEREKLESQKLAVERLAAEERSERRCETLEREREELTLVLSFHFYMNPFTYIILHTLSELMKLMGNICSMSLTCM